MESALLVADGTQHTRRFPTRTLVCVWSRRGGTLHGIPQLDLGLRLLIMTNEMKVAISVTSTCAQQHVGPGPMVR